MRKPVAVHSYGRDHSAAWHHAFSLTQGGWAVRTTRVNGEWQVQVMEYVL